MSLIDELIRSRRCINEFNNQESAFIAYWNNELNDAEFLYDYNDIKNIIYELILNGYKYNYCHSLVKYNVLNFKKKGYIMEEEKDEMNKKKKFNKKKNKLSDINIIPDKLASGLGLSISGICFIIKKKCWNCKIVDDNNHHVRFYSNNLYTHFLTLDDYRQQQLNKLI